MPTASLPGTEAAAFAAVYAICRDPKYLQRAQRAAEFLLDNWQPDGRPICYQDPSANMGTKYVQPVTQFGDVLYYHDGILFVYHQSSDPKFREKVRKVYGWHINGEQGLLNNLQNNPWWPLQDTWDNSKSAGMPQALLAYRRMVKDAAVERAVGLMRKFLCTPKFSQRIGVIVKASIRPGPPRPPSGRPQPWRAPGPPRRPAPPLGRNRRARIAGPQPTSTSDWVPSRPIRSAALWKNSLG